VVIFPHCKINLGLRVTAKRTDGFHNLETCFYPLPFYDVLEAVRAPVFKLTVSGLPVTGVEENNLCTKAFRLLEKEYKLPPVHIWLHKVLPSGAGLAGGSSNATHTLLLLNNKFNLHIGPEKLAAYAAALGSDCPFFLHKQPMLGSGRGEILTPAAVSLAGYTVALVMPPITIGTAAAFLGIKPAAPEKPVSEIVAGPVETWKQELKNDFETTVFVQHPVLQQIKENLYRLGAVYASLTGTGSVVYGIFKPGFIIHEPEKWFDGHAMVKLITLPEGDY
jgi:4-diphosphocytidyl-2-C-methyl-D-erythritol kinase